MHKPEPEFIPIVIIIVFLSLCVIALTICLELKKKGGNMLRKISLILTCVAAFLFVILLIILGCVNEQYLTLIYLLVTPFIFLPYCMVFGHADTIVSGKSKSKQK